MSLHFINYDSGYRIVSLALDETTMNDLLHDELDFLYLQENHVFLYPKGKELIPTDIECLKQSHNYDIYEIRPDGKAHLCYDDRSIDNYFFLTDICNSNCIMCPMPEAIRRNGSKSGVDNLIEIARHIPVYTPHLTITGGEPFMIGKGIFDFFLFLREKFEETEFLLLTNGRAFAVDEIARLTRETLPLNTIVGIPIHAATAEDHDRITQAPGSFYQTVSGIKKILRLGIRVELRVVVCRLNVDAFSTLADYVIRELTGVEYISVMAAEMTGNAYINRSSVWMPYSMCFSRISAALMKLIGHGIDVKLYNFPLCTVDKKYWTICAKSISPEKVRFADCCRLCRMKDACGGVFSGTFNMESEDLKPLI